MDVVDCRICFYSMVASSVGPVGGTVRLVGGTGVMVVVNVRSFANLIS